MRSYGKTRSACLLVVLMVLVFGLLLTGFSCLSENNYFDAGTPSMIFEKHLYDNHSGNLAEIPGYSPDVFKWKGGFGNGKYWVDVYCKETQDGSFVYLIRNCGPRDCYIKTGFLTWITGRKHHLPAKSALVISVEKLPAIRAGITRDLIEILEPRGWDGWFTIYPAVRAEHIPMPVPKTSVEGGR